MLLAIDVYYNKQSAKVVGALFNWDDKEPRQIITCLYNNVLPYESGHFYKRELPCILELLKQIDLSKIKVIIIDGHCYINNNNDFGLGAYLYESLNNKIPIIGVAKNKFKDTDTVTTEIFRGKSKKPLYVSTKGYCLKTAAINIKNMHGLYRIPSILKAVDTETKKIN
ncbi:endonuclease V [uncultured Lacinutrix sp.]|uniref:endonuclease V n=1 Tax=uncultured Lacinutrix sp. TaxID=574032 RepID=UPI00262EFC14|nr:endonuclease V [uncultured Lacinutrix sp.]